MKKLSRREQTEKMKESIELNKNCNDLNNFTSKYNMQLINMLLEEKATLIESNRIKDHSVKTRHEEAKKHLKLIISSEMGEIHLYNAGYNKNGQAKYELGHIERSAIPRQESYRVIASLSCRTYIDENSDVHHIDGDHFNDDPNNLLILPKLLHIMYHSKYTGAIDLVEEIIKESGKGNYSN